MSPENGRTQVYFGREKPLEREWGGRLPIALVYPQSHRIGLSTLGWQAVYRLIMDHPDFAPERFFLSPEQEPQSFDFGRPLARFPLIGFSLNFEFDFVGLVQVLDKAGIPPLAKDNSNWPLVLAGGPISFLNPAPLEPFVDVVYVGEATGSYITLLERVKDAWLGNRSKGELLEEIQAFPGVYVPGKSPIPVARQVHDQEHGLAQPAFSCFVSPEAEFSDTLLLEVNRGCPYGCRFCAAGYIYRPPRAAEMERLQEIVRRAGPRKVGLVGTALTDWPWIRPFLQWLNENKIQFSLSSLRADGLDEEFLSFLRHTGTRTVTFALEGVSSRLRRAMNKNLNEDRFLEAVSLTSKLQFNHLKIYLILGWPGESDEDYEDFASFLARIHDAVHKGRGRKKSGLGHLTLSASCLVPKPWTPLQWAPMAGEEELKGAIERIRKIVKPYSGIRFTAEKPFAARMQGLLARGGAELQELILLGAEENGNWRKAVKRWSGDPSLHLDRARGRDEVFPWEVVDTGVSREFLWKEWERYKAGEQSPACPQDCSVCMRCGMQGFLE